MTLLEARARPDSRTIDPEALTACARAEEARGDLEASVALWREVLTLTPEAGPAHGALGQLLMTLDRPSEAIPHLRVWAEATGDSATPWKRLARACEHARAFEEATLAWRQVLACDPDNALAQRRLAALALRPVPGAALTPRQRQAQAEAVAQLARGETAAAAAGFIRLVRERPDHAPAWVGLRGALYAQGDKKRARGVGRAWARAQPAAQAVIDAAMARPLSPRGLVMDPRESFRVLPKEEVLTRAASPEAFRGADDAYLVIEPGGRKDSYSPVISLEPDGRDRIVPRRATIETSVMSLAAGMVVGRGLPVTRSGALIAETLKFRPAKMWAGGPGEGFMFDGAAFRDGTCNVTYFDRPALLLAGPHDRSFGDWIDDYPPKLALAAAAGLDCPVVIRSGPVPQFVDMLEALGVSRDRLLFHDPGAVSVFPRLYVVSWPVMSLRVMDGIFDVYRRAARPPPKDRPRLYLSRAHVAKRPLVNEAEVRERFVRRGFQVVYPETLSFEAQLELFAGPAVVAGPFGSAFHNLVFSAQKPVSLALIPPSYAPWMKDIAFFFGLWDTRFAYVHGAREGAGDAWSVPIDKVEAGIEAVLEAAG